MSLLPIGDRLDGWQARPLPERKILSGRYVRLEPLSGHHADKMAEDAIASPDDWAYLGAGPFTSAAEFRALVETQSNSQDAIFYAVVDPASGEARGYASLMRIDSANGVIEVGNMWFGRRLRRTPAATEVIYLLAAYVFDGLRYRRFEWKCNALNQPSRRAAERFGFTFEGIFRQHMVTKGCSRDTAWFAMIDAEWPPIRAAFEEWLAPDNITSAGSQRRRLADIRIG